MSLWTQPRTSVRHALWLGGLLVTLGGLFGMHGLDNHGGAGMDTVTHTSMTAPGHGAVSASGAMTDTTGHLGATGMCMAVLFLSLLAFIVRLCGTRVPPLLGLAARSLRAPLFRCRDPDPPCLFRLSIQRC